MVDEDHLGRCAVVAAARADAMISHLQRAPVRRASHGKESSPRRWRSAATNYSEQCAASVGLGRLYSELRGFARLLVSYRTLVVLHPIDGEVVVVDRRPPPHQLDAHRRRAAVEVVVLDLARPPPAAHREGEVDQRADDHDLNEDQC